ncbi:hypothetical protein ABT112_27885 [Streptomyces sp. NPDC002055]|uniref:hypothetical protein n=1 Tax=Streptomyces sp. NPDC002055 TaxID=3154534 RepID=UPI003330B4B3
MTRTKQILVTLAIAAATAGIGAAPAMAGDHHTPISAGTEDHHTPISAGTEDHHTPISAGTEDHHAGVAPVEDAAVQGLPGDHHSS